MAAGCDPQPWRSQRRPSQDGANGTESNIGVREAGLRSRFANRRRSILSNLLRAVLGGPQEAQAFNCQFCVSECPADVDEFCAERFCEFYGAGCAWLGQPSCPQYQVNCNLI